MVDVAGVRFCICFMCLMLASAMSNACARLRVSSFDRSSRWTFRMAVPAMSCSRIFVCHLPMRICISALASLCECRSLPLIPLVFGIDVAFADGGCGSSGWVLYY